MATPYPSLKSYLHFFPTKAYLNSNSWIELFYPCGNTGEILPNMSVKGIRYSGQRPCGFIWHNPQACKVTKELIDWVHREFVHIFISDAFKWQASTYTAPKELQCHLLGLTSS